MDIDPPIDGKNIAVNSDKLSKTSEIIKIRWYALLVVCLGSLMVVIDETIVNVALPSIKTNLMFSDSMLAWIINAYLLTFGGFLLLAGRMGDLYGYRSFFLLGLVIFTISSLMSGLSSSQELLITARAGQGLGGAIITAISLSLIVNLFKDEKDRARAMGIFGSVLAGGGSIGVFLGGVLTSTLSWHWIFLVNIPIGIIVFILGFFLIPNIHNKSYSKNIDIFGAVSITSGLIIAVFAIVNGNDAGWLTIQTTGLLFLAILLMFLFIFIESKVMNPLIPLRILRLRNITISNIIGILWAASMFAWFFLSALYMQLILGYSPLEVANIHNTFTAFCTSTN